MSELKPCPFCGKVINTYDFVYGVHYHEELRLWILDHTCNYDKLADPSIDVTMTVYGKSMGEVIERWNNRAEIQAN